MVKPLFTYAVKDTPWYVVVAKGASHFYFDSETGTSVWQLSDTDIDDFASKVNFDELGILFAKANGLRIGPAEHVRKKRRLSGSREHVTQPEVGDDVYDIVSDLPEVRSSPKREHSQEETSLLSRKEGADSSPAEKSIEDAPIGSEEAEQDDEVSDIDARPDVLKSTPAGLDLGYSSSEEDEDLSEEHKEAADSGSDGHADSPQSEHSFDNEDSGSEQDVNSGLDLGFESDGDEPGQDPNDTARHEFEALLDEHKAEISTYDPWFLVEEELLPKFSQNPAFYAVPDAVTREKIFDEWVVSRTNAHSKSQQSAKSCGKYPTPKLLLLRYLQEYKPEVKKMYYGEFYKKHAAGIDAITELAPTINPENVYRELRVTLNDYAAYERSAKKHNVAGNLKVAHVEAYLRQKLTQYSGKLGDAAVAAHEETSFFDRWMHLCNELSLPEAVVCDATNFILGDEKRFAGYLRVLGPADQV
ncbi:hypothetical protein JCM33374_g871 [Metschnikowia sp. JCM 33374]|nr:hypothetical protein JCM33374_g871 [Metschnikowia sp. JCM 33374]